MSEFMFGSGDGHLGARAGAIARRHGAELCNYTDPGCRCGHGCPPHTCKESRRHWFTTRNLGSPFNENTERAVIGALVAAGTAKGRGRR